MIKPNNDWSLKKIFLPLIFDHIACNQAKNVKFLTPAYLKGQKLSAILLLLSTLAGIVTDIVLPGAVLSTV